MVYHVRPQKQVQPYPNHSRRRVEDSLPYPEAFIRVYSYAIRTD